jgi:hypothetical protein
LFLGYFGGKSTTTRLLLYLGAPLSIGTQARPVKIWFKTVFYMLSNPPQILLSFLPAPHQAILSVDVEASLVDLYGEDGAKHILQNSDLAEAESSTPTISEDEEEESDADGIEADEYDSEEEVDDEEDDFSDDE